MTSINCSYHVAASILLKDPCWGSVTSAGVSLSLSWRQQLLLVYLNLKSSTCKAVSQSGPAHTWPRSRKLTCGAAAWLMRNKPDKADCCWLSAVFLLIGLLIVTCHPDTPEGSPAESAPSGRVRTWRVIRTFWPETTQNPNRSQRSSSSRTSWSSSVLVLTVSQSGTVSVSAVHMKPSESLIQNLICHRFWSKWTFSASQTFLYET